MMRAVKNQAVYIKNSLFAKYHLNPPLHWHWKLPGVFKHSCKDLLDTVWYLRRLNNSYNELLLFISWQWVSQVLQFYPLPPRVKQEHMSPVDTRHCQWHTHQRLHTALLRQA